MPGILPTNSRSFSKTDFLGLAVLLTTLWCGPLVVAAPPQDAAAAVKFYQTQVRPLLKKHCYSCHGEEENVKGGLRVDSRSALLRGGDTGSAVELDNPSESLLLSAVNYESYEMPPSGQLESEQIAILARWVEMGLPWTPSEVGEEEKPTDTGGKRITAEAKKFWSYQPVQRPSVPATQSQAWARTPIDAFVLEKLDQAGLAPTPPATRATLIRRAYYDLTGLPPSPSQVRAFLADRSPRAFEKVVDRLLCSPHYGERWARHWLDLVRYAETNSYERDGAKPYVWRYRDYVIRSFNDDKPADQFFREQLAGDELDAITPDSIVATGFYRLGLWQDEPVDPEKALYDDLDDLVSTTGQVFLGMTIGCARCHEHKLDPVSQEDYYRMLAFFRNVRRYGQRSHQTVLEASVRTIATEQERHEHAELVTAHETELADTRAALQAIEKRIRKDLVGVENDEFRTEDARIEIVRKRIPELLRQDEFDRYVALTRQRDRLRQFKPPGLAQALCVKEHGSTAPPTHVLVRGNPHVKGGQVTPGFPEVLSPPPPEISDLPTEIESSGRRLALAKWITNPNNPLTARVLVNRVWQHHFGRGIVATPNDFGFHGAPPTHPELLDWLACELVDGGWRLKRLHRLIMMSNTYQMASYVEDKSLAEDPENRWFWRFNLRRLEAEEIRDSILATNGSLNSARLFGPSVYSIIPQEVLAGQSRPGSGWGESSAADRARRSIYVHVKRSLITPVLASFDVADTDASCPVRFTTTQPTQALGMLNSEFIARQASVFAETLVQQAGDDVSRQVEFALARVFQRQPKEAEVLRGVELVQTLRSEYRLDEHESLKQFCVVALNLNEFIYLD